jgi:hypothetical protein
VDVDGGVRHVIRAAVSEIGDRIDCIHTVRPPNSCKQWRVSATAAVHPAPPSPAAPTRGTRYCFYYDEEAEAEAQGLPYVLMPRELSREEWIEKYSPKQDVESR